MEVPDVCLWAGIFFYRIGNFVSYTIKASGRMRSFARGTKVVL